MTHDFHCLCGDCSERRREFWRSGEPEVDLTASQAFSVKAILIVASAAVVFGLVWACAGHRP